MRLLFFALMIALLPLRGWMGDAMATEMALAQLQNPQFATKLIADNTHEIRAKAYFSHETGTPEAVQEVQAAHECVVQLPDSPSDAVNAYCESCAACQVCHTLALSPLAPADLTPVFSARMQPPAAATSFASADAALGQKPPIS